MARYLGPENQGTFNLARSFVAIFAIVAPLGLPNILVRELVKYPEKRSELLGSSLLARALSSLILYAIMLVIAFLANYSKLEITLISLIGLYMFGQIFDTIDNYLQSIVKLKTSSKLRILGFILGALAKLFLIYTNATLPAFGFVFAIEYLLIAIGFMIAYRKYGLHFSNLKFNKNLLKGLLITASPLMFYAALLTINMKIDQLMISKIISNEANGYYSVVVGLIEASYFIPVALGASLFPGLVKQQKVDLKQFKSSFQLLYEILLLVSVGISIVLFIGANQIITIIYGPEFASSIPIMKWYAFCPILIFYGSIRSRWLIINNLHKYSLIFLIASIIVNVLLNIYLLPILGIKGAVIAILVSYSVSFIVVPFIISETRESVIMFFKSFMFNEIRTAIKNRSI